MVDAGEAAGAPVAHTSEAAAEASAGRYAPSPCHVQCWGVACVLFIVAWVVVGALMGAARDNRLGTITLYTPHSSCCCQYDPHTGLCTWWCECVVRVYMWASGPPANASHACQFLLNGSDRLRYENDTAPGYYNAVTDDCALDVATDVAVLAYIGLAISLLLCCIAGVVHCMSVGVLPPSAMESAMESAADRRPP